MSDKDPIEEFVWRLPAAVTRFADSEMKSLADQVRRRLSGEVGLPHVSSVGASTLWHQYCDEVQQGPSPMRPFWDLHVDPYIDNQLQELSQEVALLLSAAVQWERDELLEDGEIGISDELIRDGVRSELHRLALDEPSGDMHDDFEDVDEPTESDEPADFNATMSRSPHQAGWFEVARQSGQESRSILIEFPGAETIRLSGQDMGQQKAGPCKD